MQRRDLLIEVRQRDGHECGAAPFGKWYARPEPDPIGVHASVRGRIGPRAAARPVEAAVIKVSSFRKCRAFVGRPAAGKEKPPSDARRFVQLASYLGEGRRGSDYCSVV